MALTPLFSQSIVNSERAESVADKPMFRDAFRPTLCEPRWFMRDHHMNPAEAVQALIDCGADVALAHHHGTFQLTDEAIDAPRLALGAALQAAGISPERFLVLRPGQVWQF
jgi:L-ascorbate metabolism protein UlaG (beta-lactamase superfamily)